MFDFEVKYSGGNTVSTLFTDVGIAYRIRFYCGTYRTMVFKNSELAPATKAQIGQLFGR